VIDSYQKKQITLVEFIDFFQDYQQQKLQQLEHESLLRQAVEDINFAVGKDVY
jgi:outer membrane protein, heavy metal efflux system